MRGCGTWAWEGVANRYEEVWQVGMGDFVWRTCGVCDRWV